VNIHSRVLGSNCSEHVRAETYKVDRVPFRCEIDLLPPSHQLTVHDLFQIKPAFDSSSGIAFERFTDKNSRYFCVYIIACICAEMM